MDERKQRPGPASGSPLHQPRALPAPAAADALAHPEDLARDIVARRLGGPADAIAGGLTRRFDTSGAPGLQAGAFARRFVARPLRAEPLEMTVSPYAPPQRQISAVRQGAPMWPPAAAPAAPAAHEPAPRAKVEEPSELPGDLRALLDLHRSKNRIS